MTIVVAESSASNRIDIVGKATVKIGKSRQDPSARRRPESCRRQVKRSAITRNESAVVKVDQRSQHALDKPSANRRRRSQKYVATIQAVQTSTIIYRDEDENKSRKSGN